MAAVTVWKAAQPSNDGQETISTSLSESHSDSHTLLTMADDRQRQSDEVSDSDEELRLLQQRYNDDNDAVDDEDESASEEEKQAIVSPTKTSTQLAHTNTVHSIQRSQHEHFNTMSNPPVFFGDLKHILSITQPDVIEEDMDIDIDIDFESTNANANTKTEIESDHPNHNRDHDEDSLDLGDSTTTGFTIAKQTYPQTEQSEFNPCTDFASASRASLELEAEIAENDDVIPLNITENMDMAESIQAVHVHVPVEPQHEHKTPTTVPNPAVRGQQSGNYDKNHSYADQVVIPVTPPHNMTESKENANKPVHATHQPSKSTPTLGLKNGNISKPTKRYSYKKLPPKHPKKQLPLTPASNKRVSQLIMTNVNPNITPISLRTPVTPHSEDHDHNSVGWVNFIAKVRVYQNSQVWRTYHYNRAGFAQNPNVVMSELDVRFPSTSQLKLQNMGSFVLDDTKLFAFIRNFHCRFPFQMVLRASNDDEQSAMHLLQQIVQLTAKCIEALNIHNIETFEYGSHFENVLRKMQL